jgi:septum formation protein
VIENARRKARAGRAASGARGPTLGIDTDVALDGRLLGKPADEAGARARLEQLAGRTHEVLSGVVVIDGGEVPVERAALARTEVSFAELEPRTIELYLRSGEWRDRAGGYAIQGLGSILVTAIRGDFSNVVGLPVTTLLELVPDLLD